MSDSIAPHPEPGAADHARLKSLFLAVCDLADDSARRAWLDAQGVDAAMQARVMALLAGDAAATRIGAPVAAGMAQALAEVMQPLPRPPTLQRGARLGPWRLLGSLGAGGMGQVFLAERADGLYQRQVAIKLLRGRADATALALLARERQILASLAHPHIARLLDGGTTDDGQPYLVMERVQGERIDLWCEARHAGLERRLDLFGQVCDAVAEAHRRLIVHCDIKPANVLVTDDGQAVLLDFGVARLQQPGGEATVQGLTPHYASPEQLAGGDLTPASDVFSLGRLLAGLLQGPPLPRMRQREMQALLARALAADVHSRYRDVAALQDDLQRWREHRPLAAMPARWHYQATKLLRRQWPAALAGTAALLLVAAFTWQLAQERDRARAAEAQAQREAAAAEQASQFLVGLFEGADPAQSGVADIGARELVDRGRDRVARELAGQPALLARMQGVLGQVYQQMGRPGESLPLLEAALAAEQQLPRSGPRREEAALQARVAMALANADEPRRAEGPARRAVELLQPWAAVASAGDAAGVADALLLANAADTLGFVLTQLARYDDAAAHLGQALALRRRHLGPAHPQLAVTLHHLGMLHTARGALEEGERWFRDALVMKRALLRTNHPSVMNSLQTLAANLSRQGRPDEAEALLRELLVQREALFGRHSSDVQITLNELGNVLQDGGRTDEAVARYRQALEVGEQVHGAEHIALAATINNLGTALEDAEQPEAEALLRRSLALRRARLPAGDLAIARAEHNLARWLLREGRAGLARPLAEAALAARTALLASGHRDRLDSELQAAALALAEGRAEAAAALLSPLAAPATPMRDGHRLLWLRLQGRLASQQGRHEQARQHYAEAEALAPRVWPGPHPAHAGFGVERAAAEWRAGQPDAVRRLLQQQADRLARLPASGPTRRAAEALQRQLRG